MVQIFCLLALLHCIDTEWAIRLLVGTYVDEHLYEQALEELQNLPNTPENAEFIALYQAIIEGGLEGSGKSSAAIVTVNTIADNAVSTHKTLAQSVLAIYNGADYIRHGAPINLPNSGRLQVSAFNLLPNPAQDQVTVMFTRYVKPNQTMKIFDLQGRLVLIQKDIAQNTLVNVAKLQTGIYFCRLSEEADVVKLVIVR
ncbi:MAG: T9SS type A sorting domain-containing protein [Sphingobacteriales bacterium]|nr:MAG: T9SS type A sorting domain-containing protein [Sphingobacteriales bacterium]